MLLHFMIIIIRKPKNLTYHKLIRKSSQILVLYLTKYTSYDCSFHCWLRIKYNSIEKITLITRYSDIPSSGWAIGSSGKWCKAALATSACQEEKYYCISLLLVTGNTFTLNELFFLTLSQPESNINVMRTKENILIVSKIWEKDSFFYSLTKL